MIVLYVAPEIGVDELTRYAITEKEQSWRVGQVPVRKDSLRLVMTIAA